MTRNLTETEDLTCTVYLKNGQSYRNKDIYSLGTEIACSIFAFWDGDEIVMLPWDTIVEVRIHTKKA